MLYMGHDSPSQHEKKKTNKMRKHRPLSKVKCLITAGIPKLLPDRLYLVTNKPFFWGVGRGWVQGWEGVRGLASSRSSIQTGYVGRLCC